MKEITLRDVTRLLAYTLGALATVTIYLIIPLMVVLSTILHDNWSRLVVALGLLAMGEIVVVIVLVRTTQRERREAIRKPANFDVEMNTARPGNGDTEFSLSGHAVNASRTGVGILVEPDRSLNYPSGLSVRMHLPESSVTAKARVAASEEILADNHLHHLLRLQFVKMDEDDQRRYLRYLGDPEKSSIHPQKLASEKQSVTTTKRGDAVHTMSIFRRSKPKADEDTSVDSSPTSAAQSAEVARALALRLTSSNEIVGRLGDLEDIVSAVGGYRKKLDRGSETVNNLAEDLSEHVEQISSRRSELEEADRKLNALCDTLEQETTEVSKLRSQIEENVSRINELLYQHQSKE